MEDLKDQDILLIEQYLRNKLNEKERTLFEQKLASNKEFSLLYNDEKQLYSYIKAEGNQDLKNYLIDVEDTQNHAKDTVNSASTLVKVLAMAASFTILVGAYFMFFSNNSLSSPQLYSEYFTPYPSDLAQLKRSADDETTILQTAMIAYQQGQFDKAEGLLAQIENHDQQDRIYYYTAICQLANDKNNSSIQTLSRLNSMEGFFYEEGVTWYLALAHLKTNKTKKAKVYLQNIIDSDQKYQRSAAKEILVRLSDL